MSTDWIERVPDAHPSWTLKMDSDLDRKDRSSKLMDFVLEVIYINMWRTLASVTKSLKKRKKKHVTDGL